MNNFPKRIIHLLSDISIVNYGVWNVVISTFPYLEDLGWQPEIWFPRSNSVIPDEIKESKYREIEKAEKENLMSDIKTNSTLFLSHGCWSWATKVGKRAKKFGFRWIAVPHGMLEPWAMKQKRLKKKVYFEYFEKPKLQMADVIVAVGKPEYDNLKKWFKNVHHIPNGIIPFTGLSDHPITGSLDQQIMPKAFTGDLPQDNRMRNISDISPETNVKERKLDDSTTSTLPHDYSSSRLPLPPLTFLFLSRLHHKKGVVPLVEAWLSSNLNGDDQYQLIIAGPDEGELDKINTVVGNAGRMMDLNIRISGPVYGKDKENLLVQSDFFVLPSQSEGFPTSILEAMTHGCIPLFTEGCNFPEAIEKGVGIRIEYDIKDVQKKLEEIAGWSEKRRIELSRKGKSFVDKNYNWKDIAGKQLELYEKVLGSRF